ncbi:MAG: benzoyl-CoA reductase subunit C [Deltaproteobacteria bacterium]|nr:benzoyl-CoA reductase subunit C [Deltaproteobacteria bacterium]
MRTPEQIAEQCEQIALDDHLGEVTKWREETGGHAAGHLPVYTPREVIDAAGMLPVGVVGSGEMEIIRGDAYFQSYICHLPRSVVEMGLTGRLDSLDAMIFPATCDVIRNLSGMWKLLFPEKLVHYLDVPHNHDPEVGGVFYAGELRRLAKDLSKISGVEVTDDALRTAIEKRNESRRLMRKLFDLRSDSPEKVPTSELYVLMRAGFQMPQDAHDALVKEYYEAALASSRPEFDNARVVVIGSFCEQPPIGLIRTLEKAGCYIVDDDLLLGAHFILDDLELEGDPFTTLAKSWFDHARSMPSRFVPDEVKGEYLVQLTKKRQAEGVIFAAPSFCDPALLEQPMLQDALERAGIAHTSFKYAENNGQFHPILEQAGTFTDSIKLWSEAS